jgi:hypothetical protein
MKIQQRRDVILKDLTLVLGDVVCEFGIQSLLQDSFAGGRAFRFALFSWGVRANYGLETIDDVAVTGVPLCLGLRR